MKKMLLSVLLIIGLSVSMEAEEVVDLKAVCKTVDFLYEFEDGTLESIRKIETKGFGDLEALEAIGDRSFKNKAYGAFQIRKPALDEVKRKDKNFKDLKIEDIKGASKEKAFIQAFIAAEYLTILKNKLGSMDKAITAYNLGIGNMKNEVKVKNNKYLSKWKKNMKNN